jgi:CHAT domain-containing protein
MTVAALQAVVPRDALLLVFVVGDRDSYAWGVRRGQVRVERIDAGREVLARLVAAAAPPREEAGAAARLRQLLLAPFDAMLADEDLLVLVPDGPLHSLAFAALPGRRARFVVEEHPMLTAPSASAWQQASQQLAVRRPDRPRVLAIGNPAIPASVGDLPDLPHADAEARVVAGIYDAQPLIGAAATRAAVVDGLQRADIVHFAGHAVVDAVHPLASRLVIADPAGAGLTGGDIRGLTLRRARLVVLSACETVGGMSTRSEGPIGLARAFLAAGAPAIVASHWVAADRAARELFEQFHRAFVSTGDAARALRVAQRHLISSGDPALAAPAAWAGFVAIGGGPPSREEIR